MAATWKDTLFELSTALDGSPRLLAAPWVVGFDRAAHVARGDFEALLGWAGFAPGTGDLFRRGEEVYENRLGASPLGYLTFGEIEEWKTLLLRRCVERGVVLHLPRAEALLAFDATYVSACLRGLTDTDVWIVTHPSVDPRAEVATLVALEVLDWPRAWIVLFETLETRGALSEVAAEAIVEAVAARPLEELQETVERLASRRGASAVRPSTLEAMRAHLRDLVRG